MKGGAPKLDKVIDAATKNKGTPLTLPELKLVRELHYGLTEPKHAVKDEVLMERYPKVKSASPSPQRVWLAQYELK